MSNIKDKLLYLNTLGGITATIYKTTNPIDIGYHVHLALRDEVRNKVSIPNVSARAATIDGAVDAIINELLTIAADKTADKIDSLVVMQNFKADLNALIRG